MFQKFNPGIVEIILYAGKITFSTMRFKRYERNEFLL